MRTRMTVCAFGYWLVMLFLVADVPVPIRTYLGVGILGTGTLMLALLAIAWRDK